MICAAAPKLYFGAVARRIEIELTSARPDGTWTWRAAGALNPTRHCRRCSCFMAGQKQATLCVPRRSSASKASPWFRSRPPVLSGGGPQPHRAHRSLPRWRLSPHSSPADRVAAVSTVPSEVPTAAAVPAPGRATRSAHRPGCPAGDLCTARTPPGANGNGNGRGPANGPAHRRRCRACRGASRPGRTQGPP